MAAPRGDGDQVTCSEQGGALVFALRGRLDATTMGGIWRTVRRELDRASTDRVAVEGADIDYCDGAGAALIARLERVYGERFELRSFPDDLRPLLVIYSAEGIADIPRRTPRPFFERLGRITVDVAQDLRAQISFTGELFVGIVGSLVRPRRIRWRTVLDTAERAGVDALPIVALVGFLLGLILAFQSAMPMRQFGAQIYVADLLGVSLIRELGPLMTAILVAGRTGSAFAAEIGTMRVNEEVDALETMGLDPVRFLAVPRVLAAIAMTPLLSCFCILAGLVGGALVMLSLGFPLVMYVDRIFRFVGVIPFLAGMLKAAVFALIIAGVGCQRGLRTGHGAAAVGTSTTSAVVSGIVLIAVADAVFAVVLYALDI